MIEQEHEQDIYSVLSYREKRVLDLSFGLIDGKPRTHRQIAKEEGISERRVRFVEKKALRKLSHTSGEVPPEPGSPRIK